MASEERQLRKLARHIYDETKNDIWLGGKMRSNYEGGPSGSPWPKKLAVGASGSGGWGSGVTWSLSPEIELGGHKLRVCVSYKAGEDEHRVRVYADNLLGYPGGMYKVSGVFIKRGWSWRIALAEAENGGLPGPVGNRTLLLKDDRQKARGVITTHDPGPPEPVLCSMCKRAIEEAEAEVDALEVE